MEGNTAQHRVIPRSQFVRMSLLILGVVVIVGGLLVMWVAGYLNALSELAESDPALAALRARFVLQAALAATVLVAVLVGSYVAWYGYRAVRSECFPPPGSWVIEGRPVQTGSKARALGWVQIILGIAMAGMACAAVYSAWAVLP